MLKKLFGEERPMVPVTRAPGFSAQSELVQESPGRAPSAGVRHRRPRSSAVKPAPRRAARCAMPFSRPGWAGCDTAATTSKSPNRRPARRPNVSAATPGLPRKTTRFLPSLRATPLRRAAAGAAGSARAERSTVNVRPRRTGCKRSGGSESSARAPRAAECPATSTTAPRRV